MPGPSLRELRRRTGRVVRLRHKGTGLGDDVIMLPGANAASCMSLRNESCSHGFVSQDSMSGTPRPQRLTAKAEGLREEMEKGHLVGLLNLIKQWGLRCLGNLLLLLQRKIW